MPNPKSEPTGRLAVLDLVKREGPVAAETLAEALGITAMAVRQHLAALEAEGLAASETRARPRGRPAKFWQATPKAEAHFPDSHSQLVIDLVTQMKKAFGEEGLDRIIKLRTAEQARTYRETTEKASSLKGRLDALARIR